MNLATPKAAAKLERLFNKPASGACTETNYVFGVCCKLVYLSKPEKVTDSNKNISLQPGNTKGGSITVSLTGLD